MALHDDLLAQARALVPLPPIPGAGTVPAGGAAPAAPTLSQADLRRGISTAYYALFHLLAFEATELLSLAQDTDRRRFVRALSHTAMKKAARAVASQGPLALFGQIAFPGEVVYVAQAFVDLQEGRHRADYEVADDVKRTTADRLVSQAETAFSRWQVVRGQDRANLFLHLLSSYEQFTKKQDQ